MISKTHRRTSEILQDVMNRGTTGTVTLSEFMRLLGDRSFALAILIFALPNSLPIPGIPGVSTITGLPITFIAAQMLLGREAIWLPEKLARKTFSQEMLNKFLTKTIPYVVKLEKMLKPRWDVMVSSKAERLIGLVFVLLSLIIALPIPGGNFLPGLSMSLIALGLLEKDGMFVAGALTFVAATATLMVEIILGAWKWIVSLF